MFIGWHLECGLRALIAVGSVLQILCKYLRPMLTAAVENELIFD